MLREITLSPDPAGVVARYGLDYDSIKNLPHFQAKLSQVEHAMLIDGELTTVVAGIGLHTAVEKLAMRVNDERISTGDLVKSIETLKKVKDGIKVEDNQTAAQGVSLVINIPAMGAAPAKKIEVTQNNIIDVTPDGEVEDISQSGNTITITEEDFKINV